MKIFVLVIRIRIFPSIKERAKKMQRKEHHDLKRDGAKWKKGKLLSYMFQGPVTQRDTAEDCKNDMLKLGYC
jgi:hypothetical protein